MSYKPTPTMIAPRQNLAAKGRFFAVCTAWYCLSLRAPAAFRTAAQVVFTACQGGALVGKVAKGGKRWCSCPPSAYTAEAQLQKGQSKCGGAFGGAPPRMPLRAPIMVPLVGRMCAYASADECVLRSAAQQPRSGAVVGVPRGCAVAASASPLR